jgi:hypothetical protein
VDDADKTTLQQAQAFFGVAAGLGVVGDQGQALPELAARIH